MRTPPTDIDAERAILAEALLYPKFFGAVESLVRAEDFYHPTHRTVFDAMGAVHRRGRPVDVITVADQLRMSGEAPRLEGDVTVLLTDIAGKPGTFGQAERYAEIVRNKATLRRLIELCAEATSRAFEHDDARDLLADVAGRVATLSTGNPSDLTPIGSLVSEMLAEFERRGRAPTNAIPGVRFGLVGLDGLLGCLQPGDHCVVAADVGGGKTALAAQAGLRLTLYDGGSAILFSLEMTKRQLAERAFAHQGMINSRVLRSGRFRGEVLGPEHFQTLHAVAAKLYAAPLFLEDECFLLRDIAAKARAWRAKYPDKRGLVVVDFLQLVRAETARGETRARAVGAIAYGLKELAKQLGVVVISLSQLNRGPVKAKEPPTKHDLKESGDIEASADQIVLIHNPDGEEDADVDLIVDKNRHGQCRTQRAHWIARHFLFADPQRPAHWTED